MTHALQRVGELPVPDPKCIVLRAALDQFAETRIGVNLLLAKRHLEEWMLPSGAAYSHALWRASRGYLELVGIGYISRYVPL